MSARWFCGITNPNCHVRAEGHLAALGYRAFLPKLRKWVSHARQRKAVERPLLARYIFIEVDFPRQSFGPLSGVQGLEGMLTVGGEPAPIPSRFVEELINRCLSGEFDYVTPNAVISYIDEDGQQRFRTNGPMPLGAKVAIVAGEFEDLLATVTNLNGNRATVQLDGTRTRIRIAEDSLRPA